MAKRQIATVIDLNKCLGCQTCTMACKQLWTNKPGREYMFWANVETHPGKGFPRDWQNKGGGFKDGVVQLGDIPHKEDYGDALEYNYEDMLLKGQGDQVVPNMKPKWGPNWEEDQGEGEWPNSYYFYLPRLCNHCSNPACVAACPRKAVYKRDEDGIVLIDQDRCRGYRKCVQACPYKKIFFNVFTGKSEKCIFCYPRVEKGVAPACAAQCPGRTRFVSYLDDEDGPVYKIVHKWKAAIPLHPEYGTEPNVYYVPPISPPKFMANGQIDESQPRIPLSLLKHLFSDKVADVLKVLETEMEKRRRGQNSELLEILIGYTNEDRFKLEQEKV